MMEQKNPFGDSRGLLAIVLIGVFFALWNWYMTANYPQKPAPAATAPVAAEKPMATDPSTSTDETVSRPPVELKSPPMIPEKTFSYEGEKISFQISSQGMGLNQLTLKKYTDRDGNPIQLGQSSQAKLFELRLNKGTLPVPFDISEKSPGHYVGTTVVGDMTIVREIKYDEAKHYFESSLDIKNVDNKVSIDIMIPEKIATIESSSFLFPSYEHQDFFVSHSGGTAESVNFSSATSNVSSQFNNVDLVAISSQYFTAAVMDRSDITPSFDGLADLGKKEALARVYYEPVQAGVDLHLSQIFFAGSKSIDTLQKIDPELIEVINLGMLSFIAKPMLLIMKTAYSWVGNWGVAIILLTLLVRLIVFPLYMMSMKSMKAMQKIQPKMQALREKHKDDPMTMNREVMALMKENKANPLGGCLPMLLQIPIFFALFRVIGSSVELYQAPFMLWIQDLSLHDKFFILPILMGVTMFVQQKLTPTTMDPAQAKIMAFMPLIFSVFMLYLPSGLTLYMLVSAVFGITQQYFIMKDKNKAAA